MSKYSGPYMCDPESNWGRAISTLLARGEISSAWREFLKLASSPSCTFSSSFFIAFVHEIDDAAAQKFGWGDLVESDMKITEDQLTFATSNAFENLLSRFVSDQMLGTHRINADAARALRLYMYFGENTSKQTSVTRTLRNQTDPLELSMPAA